MEGRKLSRIELVPLTHGGERRRLHSGSGKFHSVCSFNKLRRLRKFSCGLILLIFIIIVYTILLPDSPLPETVNSGSGQVSWEEQNLRHKLNEIVQSHHLVADSKKQTNDTVQKKVAVTAPPPSSLNSGDGGAKKVGQDEGDHLAAAEEEEDEEGQIDDEARGDDKNLNPVPPPQKAHTETGGGVYHKYPVRESGMTCRLPNLDPFDESVMKFMTPPEIIECENKDFPMLFTLDVNSTLVNLKNPQDFGYEQCCFLDLKRKSKDDDEVVIAEECTPITQNRTEIPEGQENIVISCKDVNSNLWSDMDIFGLPRLKPELEDYVKEKKKESPEVAADPKENYNVIVLGLDAVSHMNFHRTMPLTYDFLVNQLSAVYFDGYMKVGENTFPNAMAALAGRSVRELKDIGCWTSEAEYLDSCPFIWKNFSDLAFYTSYGEDAPLIGTFNYFKKGFNSPPVDYYLRPLMLSHDLYIGHENLLNANVCYGPRLAFEVLLEYIKHFASVMDHSRRYFQYIWANSLFHDTINSPILGDKLLMDTLQWFLDNGYLSETIFVIMSDHGMRWGDLRETLQGRIEERMPLLYMVLPPSFRKQYKRAMNNIKGNRRRLTTHFDLHETLMDILYLRTRLEDRELETREKQLIDQTHKKVVPRGLSLFLPIPKSRTCETAEVPEHFCVCSSLRPIDIKNNKEVETGAAQIVTEINSKVEAYKDCATLSLAEIISAHILVQDGSMDDLRVTTTQRTLDGNEQIEEQDNSEVNNVVTLKTIFEITIKTYPGLALFEASVSRDVNGTYSVQQISRANLYGRQSQCVTESALKMFCYCVN